MKHNKAAAYHGVEHVKFAPRVEEAYAAGEKILPLLYAKSLNLSSLLEAVEQHADDHLLFRVPNDKGYDAEMGTTAPDTALELVAGYALEGAGGIISANQVDYARGALYYEFKERDGNGKVSMVKCWLYNVEVGKGSPTHTTDESSVAFGTYTYPLRIYGDAVMSSDGAKPYIDDRGMPRTAFLYTARVGDEGYDMFGDAVPVPKVAAPSADG